MFIIYSELVKFPKFPKLPSSAVNSKLRINRPIRMRRQIKTEAEKIYDTPSVVFAGIPAHSGGSNPVTAGLSR